MYYPCSGSDQADRRLQMGKPLGLLLIVWACLFTACGQVVNAGGQPSLSATPVVVVETVTSPEPTPTPASCTPLPAGMTLFANRISGTRVRLEITGLKPGEKLIIIAHAEVPGYALRNEGRPIEGADSDGRFTIELGLSLLPGSTKNQWEIQVIHSRGVACTEVTLP